VQAEFTEFFEKFFEKSFSNPLFLCVLSEGTPGGEFKGFSRIRSIFRGVGGYNPPTSLLLKGLRPFTPQILR